MRPAAGGPKKNAGPGWGPALFKTTKQGGLP
jgi:hypothetical protein